MTNMRLRQYSILLTILLGLVSCKKFLEQEPYNRISVNDIFKDLEGARTTLVGCYDNLKATDAYLRDLSVYPEVTAGNIKYARAANQLLLSSYSFLNTPNENDMEGCYRNAYNTIYRANNIFANINRVADANPQQKARLLAEAFMFRAIAHFDLLRIFAQGYGFSPGATHPGIVLRPVNPAATTLPGPPASVKEGYDFVLQDIDSAINRYANSVSIYPSGNDRSWFSQDAALALKARVSLYKEDWPTVITLCNTLISSNRYPLLSNSGYVNAWRGKVILSESIFELAFGNRIGGSLGDYYNPNLTLTGHLAAADDLLSLYASGDVRGRTTMYTSQLRNSITYYFTRKYQGTADSANNLRLFRLSECYLSRAEAYAESGNLTAALADLNLIRRRANPAAPNLVATSASQVLDEIFNERRRELCFEGHAFFDLGRKKKNLVRTDCIGANCSFIYPNERYACPKPLTP
jgi:starch-binding outer membrane protein, SusD/RagB family